MKRFLTLIVLALFVSVPALADTVNIETESGTKIKISEGSAAAASGGGAFGASSLSMNSVVKNHEVTTTDIWNQKNGNLVRSVDTIRVGPLVGSVFVNEDGCPLLYAMKYPTLPCPRP